MPLPDGEKLEWPPDRRTGLQRDFREWAAWYAGDTDSLAKIYSGGALAPYNLQPRPSQNSWADRLKFWGRKGNNAPQSRQRIHVPVASDIATTSADLLFGDEPKILFPKTSDAKDAPNPTQERFEQLADEIGFYNGLLEGAEVCAALGGSYLRPYWDQEVSSHPLFDIIHADSACPEWRGDQLHAVTFWNILHVDGATVFRLLERHENGHILSGLYKGTADMLGSQVALNNLTETADIVEDVVLVGELARFKILPDYVPNVKPHRKYRSQPQGRADFQGVESLMDSLDETYTSLMRDIRLGQARLVVSEDALTRGPRGAGATFDADQELFTRLDLEPGQNTGMPIEQVQFVIRTTEHLDTCYNLFERIVTTSGYSPQSFGLHIDGQAETGTALRVREGKTLKTRQRKARYWVPAVVSTCEKLLAIDKEVFGNREIEIVRPTVTLADAVVNNPVEMAQSLNMFAQAKAMSIKTRVKLAQPELTEDQVVAEVQQILNEDSVSFDPTGGFP